MPDPSLPNPPEPSDAQIEAAARAISKYHAPDRTWEQIGEFYQTRNMDLARRVLIAAALNDEVSRAKDARIEAAVEWGRSVAQEVDVMPLFRALGVIDALKDWANAPMPRPWTVAEREAYERSVSRALRGEEG